MGNNSVKQDLYIFEDHILSYYNHRIRIEDKSKGSDTLDTNTQELPLGTINQIIIFGDVIFNSILLKECSKREIPVIFMNSNASDHWGTFEPCEIGPKSAQLKWCQAHLTPQSQIMLIKEILVSQIEKRIQFLQSRQLVFPELIQLSNTKEKINQFLINENFLLTDINNKTLVKSIDSLRGLEGIASQFYWSMYRKLLRKDWEFSGREKHPSPDPVNCLLSFTYSLLASRLEQILEMIGFEPYWGYLHYQNYGRKSLIYDFLELFRPDVERWIYRWLNQYLVNKTHFEQKSSNICELTKEGKKNAIILFQIEYKKAMIFDDQKIDYHTFMIKIIYRIAEYIRNPNEKLQLLNQSKSVSND